MGYIMYSIKKSEVRKVRTKIRAWKDEYEPFVLVFSDTNGRTHGTRHKLICHNNLARIVNVLASDLTLEQKILGILEIENGLRVEELARLLQRGKDSVYSRTNRIEQVRATSDNAGFRVYNLVTDIEPSSQKYAPTIDVRAYNQAYGEIKEREALKQYIKERHEGNEVLGKMMSNYEKVIGNRQ